MERRIVARTPKVQQRSSHWNTRRGDQSICNQKKPEDEIWDSKMIDTIQGTPQQPNPNKSSSKIPIRIKFDEPSTVAVDQVVPARQEGPRRFRITIPMLVKYGYTEGCEGCRFKQAGLGSTRAHNEECRRRIAEKLKDDPEHQKTLNVKRK